MVRRRINLFIVCAAFVGPCAACLSVAAQESPAPPDRPVPTPDEIDAWIAELDDNQYLVREKATQNLLDAGNAALDALLEAANADRPEPADRAIWILRRLGRSPDGGLAIPALERLIEVRGRPVLVEKAETELAERSVRACQERLAPLGAEISMQYEPIDVANFVPVLHLRVGPQWKGTSEDLRPLAQLRHQFHFRLEGAPIDDAAVKHFEEKEKLAHLQLLYTKVTPAAVDALKLRHPAAVVYMRNDALLGISAENHAKGVVVQTVENPSAASAAGIMPGDVITSFDGKPLADFDRLTARIAQHRPGDTVDVELVRGEEQKKVAVTLGRWSDRR